MRKAISILGLLAVSLTASADFDGAKIDLVKFSQFAATEFHSAKLPADVDEILFQDAAFATDTHALFDGSMLFAIGREISLQSGTKANKLAYRLLPQNGQSGIVLLQMAEFNTIVLIPDSLFLTFSKETSKLEINDALKKIANSLGAKEYQFSALVNLKRIAIDLSEPSVPNLLALIEKLNKLKLGARLEFNFEKYRTPYDFGLLQYLSKQKSADLDKLRDVVPKYLNAGKKFTNSQSLVPEIFAANK